MPAKHKRSFVYDADIRSRSSSDPTPFLRTNQALREGAKSLAEHLRVIAAITTILAGTLRRRRLRLLPLNWHILG